MSLDAETHSKGFFFLCWIKHLKHSRWTNTQKNGQVNLNPPRLSKTWLKDEAKMMKPFQAKCPRGVCVLRPRISSHLHPCCCTPLDYWWERCWSHAAAPHFHPPCYAPAGKTAGMHLFIIPRHQIFFLPLAKRLLGISLAEGIVRVIWLSWRKTPTRFKNDKYFISWKCNQL